MCREIWLSENIHNEHVVFFFFQKAEILKYFKEDHQYQSEKEKTVKLFFMKKSIHTPNNSHYKLRF